MEAAKAELDELGVESYLCKTDIADRAQVQALAAKEGSEVLPICAKLEADIAELDDPDE